MKPIAQPGPERVRFRSGMTRSRLLRAVLWLSLLVAAGRAAVLVASSEVLARPDLVSAQVASDLLDAATLLGIAVLVAAVVTWLLWVAWTSRLEENAVALGVGEGSVGPRGAILWWLVPGANLMVPFGQLLGLDRRLCEGQQRSHDALLAVWWLALLASAAALIVTAVPLATAGAFGAGDAGFFLRAGLATLAWMAALVLSLRVVRQVQRDEDQRNDMLSRGWRPGAPSWPLAAPGPAPSPQRTATLASQPAAPGRARSAIPTGKTPPAGTAPAVGRWSPGRRRAAMSALPRVVVLLVVIGGLIGLTYSSRFAPSNPARTSAATTAAAVAVVTPPAGPTATAAGPASSPSSSGPGNTPPGATAAPSTPGSSAPSPSPSAPNVVLMQHMGSGDGSCQATAPASVPAGSIAAIDCQPGNAAVATLRYALYASADTAEAAYTTDLAASGIAPGTGNCFDAVAGEGSFITDDTPRGRVLCLLDANGRPTMAWVDRTLAIVGRATGSGAELKPLCDWWRTESGPA